MIDEEKLMKMFTKVYGDMGNCKAEVTNDFEEETQSVRVTKDGSLCWEVSLSELLFEYITKDWG